MIYRKKLVYIAAFSAVFLFVFVVGNDVRQSQDFAGAGVRGSVAFVGRVLDWGTALIVHAPLGYDIMGQALFGGIYAAVYIWRDDWLF